MSSSKIPLEVDWWTNDIYYRPYSKRWHGETESYSYEPMKGKNEIMKNTQLTQKKAEKGE